MSWSILQPFRTLFERANSRSSEQFRTLFEEAPVAYHEIDRRGIVRRVNRAECELLGVEPQDMVGRPIWEFVAPEEQQNSRQAVVRKMAGDVPLDPFSRPYRRADGASLLLEVRENFIRNRAGRITGMRSTLLDVTERRRAEMLERGYREVLELLAQNQPLDAIFGRFAHLIENQEDHWCCCIRIIRDGKLFACPGGRLPAGFIEETDGCPIASDAGDGVENPETALKYGLRAWWSVPMISATGVLTGSLTLYSRRPSDKAGGSEITRMHTAARLCALAIEHRQLTDQLAYQAGHDRLTGLPNRYLFDDRLRQALGISERSQKLFALLFIDLDGFKQINDSYGHAFGDEVLKTIAGRLTASVRHSDTVARIGGDEFTVILNDIAAKEDAALVGEKLLAVLTQTFEVNGWPVLVTPSIGISVFPYDGHDAGSLQRNADAAMYAIKNEGKNSFAFYATQSS